MTSLANGDLHFSEDCAFLSCLIKNAFLQRAPNLDQACLANKELQWLENMLDTGPQGLILDTPVDDENWTKDACVGTRLETQSGASLLEVHTPTT
ncbi:hypothetical protein OJAV_G00222530 [Oryzias javanicus]|uniref:Uncharacterized protein n=1 Tax=Oryzias javanicus TaxID=123683 RepID=A0A3S2NU47_ORYJA|nr:hypothetical protein OJAV_G00222530 [Oryzias javanicus]